MVYGVLPQVLDRVFVITRTPLLNSGVDHRVMFRTGCYGFSIEWGMGWSMLLSMGLGVVPYYLVLPVGLNSYGYLVS